MQVIPYEAECPAPNMCFICKQRPNTHDAGIIDTGLNFIPDVHPPTVLNGRILVCTLCVGNLATLLGWERPDEVAALCFHRDSLQAERDELAKKVEDLESGHLEAFEQLVARHAERTAESLVPAATRVREPRG